MLISSPVDPDEVMTDGTTDGTSGGATGGKYGSSDSEDNLYTTSLRLCSHCSAINMPLASITERPACDFCHSRKIKCDRQFPCENCLEAQVDCRRDRPKKSRRRRGPRTFPYPEPSEPSGSGISGPSSTWLTESSNERPSRQFPGRESIKNKRTSTDNVGSARVGRSSRPHTHVEPSTQSVREVKDGLIQQTSQGSQLLQEELQSNPSLGAGRDGVMKNAIDFLSRLANSPTPYFAVDCFDTSNIAEEGRDEGFPVELLYMMTMCPEPNAVKQSFWPDHISFQTLENMSLALVEEKADYETLTCYRVCVYQKAATMICRLPRKDRSERVRIHLEQSKKKYEHEIYKALSELDYLAPPRLILLQAFLSGALFMQNQGDMSRSWTLTAFASRTLVSLNLHAIDATKPSDPEQRDLHGALYSCYYLDKMLSALLLRPPSLPKLKVNPAELVVLNPHFPLSASLKIMVSFARIQEIVLDLDLDRSHRNGNLAVITQLVGAMEGIQNDMEKYQRQLPFRKSTYEWAAIEFGYYALFSSVLHSKQRVAEDEISREQCLKASRQSLIRLNKLQDEVSTDANFLDGYPYFLTWTLLFYPLTPFFVLFCNVVISGNLDDYASMAAVVKGMSRFVQQHPSINELYALFSNFLRLSGPVVQSQLESLVPGPNFAENCRESDLTDGHNGLAPQTAALDDILLRSNRNLQEESSLIQPDLDNDLMWDLLDFQPWLGWSKSDVLANPRASDTSSSTVCCPIN